MPGWSRRRPCCSNPTAAAAGWSATATAARRAAGEWGAEAGDVVRGPIDLVDYYRSRGARYFADLGDRPDDPRRLALHDAVRRRYKVIIDRPEVLIVDLGSVSSAGMLPHAN